MLLACQPRLTRLIVAIRIDTWRYEFACRRILAHVTHELDKLLGGGTAIVPAQALNGLGDVGKTQVALEYAHRFKTNYDLIWWIPAESADISLTLATKVVASGRRIPRNAPPRPCLRHLLLRKCRQTP